MDPKMKEVERVTRRLEEGARRLQAEAESIEFSGKKQDNRKIMKIGILAAVALVFIIGMLALLF